MKMIACIVLALCVPASAQAQLATKRTGYRVTLTSKPPGAVVRLAGRDQGKTPWTGYLRAGTWTATLHLKGYARRTKTLVVRRVRGNQRYHAELQATGGVLAIRGPAELAGALVYVNDEKAGALSVEGFRAPMPPGRYLIRLEKKGYRAQQWWAILRDGQETSRHITLEPDRRGIPLELPSHCDARFTTGDDSEPGPAVTRLHPAALERAAASDQTLAISCLAEPAADAIDTAPHEVEIHAIGGSLQINGQPRALPTSAVIPPGTTKLRFSAARPQPVYKPPTRLDAGDYTLALDTGFPRMLALGLRVGTGPLLGHPASLEAGTFLLGNRLAAFATAHWQPWSAGPWSTSVFAGTEAGSGVAGVKRARFAEIHTGAHLAASFSRVFVAFGLELELWTDLLCSSASQCPSMTDLHAHRWQWRARPLLMFTVHTTLDDRWALAATASAAFHTRPTYVAAFGALLPENDPLTYLQVGFRRTF